MNDITTIKIPRYLLKKLKKLKVNKRETYYDVIERLIGNSRAGSIVI